MLKKMMRKYKCKFVNWEKEYTIDSNIQEFVFIKSNMKLIFWEDMREHIINLSLLTPQKTIIRIEYMNIINFDENLLGIASLIKALSNIKESTREKNTFECFLNFLILNNLL